MEATKNEVIELLGKHHCVKLSIDYYPSSEGIVNNENAFEVINKESWATLGDYRADYRDFLKWVLGESGISSEPNPKLSGLTFDKVIFHEEREVWSMASVFNDLDLLSYVVKNVMMARLFDTGYVCDEKFLAVNTRTDETAVISFDSDRVFDPIKNHLMPIMDLLDPRFVKTCGLSPSGAYEDLHDPISGDQIGHDEELNCQYPLYFKEPDFMKIELTLEQIDLDVQWSTISTFHIDIEHYASMHVLGFVDNCEKVEEQISTGMRIRNKDLIEAVNNELAMGPAMHPSLCKLFDYLADTFGFRSSLLVVEDDCPNRVTVLFANKMDGALLALTILGDETVKENNLTTTDLCQNRVQ